MDRYRMLPSYRYYDVEGTSPLTLDKSVGKPLRDYKIYGNSIQDGTPSPENPVEIQSCGDKSKNLINWDYLLDNPEITKTENGYYSNTYYNNFAVASTRLGAQIKSILKPNVTYTLSRKYAGGTDGTIGNIVFSKSGTYVVASGYGVGLKSKTFSFTQEEIDSITSVYIYFTSPSAGGGTISELQLTESEEVLPYEPYGYKIPIEVGGKNLFDIENTTYYDGYLKSSGEVTSDGGFKYTDYIEVNSDSITLTLVYGGLNAPSICAYDKDKNYLTGVKYGGKTIINLNHSDMKYVRFSLTNSVISGKFNILLENGSVSTDFEPYKEPIVSNIYLDEPLYKIGDYADYIDFMNGKVVRNIFEYTFVGNEFGSSGVPFADLGTTICTYTKTIADGKLPTEVRGFSEKGVFDGKVINANDNERCAFAYNSGAKRTCFYARILKSRCANPDSPTSADFNNIYSAGTKIYGVLATPTETPITLPTIPTHKGTNVISVPTKIQPSNMQIQYYK